MQPTSLIPLLALSLAASGARADDSGQVLVSYEAALGARRISGVSHALQWNLTALPDDGAQVRLQVPVDSFESGHPAFDAVVREALQSSRHPFIEIEGESRGGAFEGVVTIRGISRPLAVRVQVERVEGRVVASASFSLLLSDFGVTLPSVADRLQIDFVARLPAAERAVVSGGVVSWSR